MFALVGAFVAGVLTTLAPCVLPLLPVIVGGSVAVEATTPSVESRTAGSVNGPGTNATITRFATNAPGMRRALLVTASLGVSVLAFTLLLRASTALLGVPSSVWSTISGGLLVLLGLGMALPGSWEWVSSRLELQARTSRRLGAARRVPGAAGALLTGAALGPVFSSCSPLYAYVVVTVFPAEPSRAMTLLGAYVVGLCGTLLLVSLAGQRLIRRLGWAVDAHSALRRGLGVVFVLVGVGVALGWDRAVQTWVIEHSPLRPWELDSGFVPDE